MGKFINTGNAGFKKILNSSYIDKTGLITYINNTFNTVNSLICFTRPRRFGKTFAAKMLSAYYDKTCDSKQLFDNLEVSKSVDFETYLNKLNVIYLDITWFISEIQDYNNIVNLIQAEVIKDLANTFPTVDLANIYTIQSALYTIHQNTNEQFYIIIDEWDALFREAKSNDFIQKEYIKLLRGLFKSGSVLDSVIIGAYMTGILPIKKYGTESALTDFIEYTMLSSSDLTRYIGFTKTEVQNLCKDNNIDFNLMQKWYNGYDLEGEQIYNPNSVMKAIKFHNIDNYWTNSESYESLAQYINLDIEGMHEDIVQMLCDINVNININIFNNDLKKLKTKDDVFTLLVHLGYLAYDKSTYSVHIPNKEVFTAFKTSIQASNWVILQSIFSNSDKLLSETINKNEQYVANAIEQIHDANTSILQYNDENSLSCIVSLAYIAAKNYYTIIRELPTGKGFADLIFLPFNKNDKPAIIFELKCDSSPEEAIQQIKNKNYIQKVKESTNNIILVGISYNKKTKKHLCKIEKNNTFNTQQTNLFS